VRVFGCFRKGCHAACTASVVIPGVRRQPPRLPIGAQASIGKSETQGRGGKGDFVCLSSYSGAAYCERGEWSSGYSSSKPLFCCSLLIWGGREGWDETDSDCHQNVATTGLLNSSPGIQRPMYW